MIHKSVSKVIHFLETETASCVNRTLKCGAEDVCDKCYDRSQEHYGHGDVGDPGLASVLVLFHEAQLSVVIILVFHIGLHYVRHKESP